MKKFVLLATGGAIGYVLGAKAGRPAYDQIMSGWTRVSHALGLNDVTRSVGRSAVDLRNAAKDRASSQVEDLMDRATDAVAPTTRPDAATQNGAEPHDDAWHQTIVAPTPST
jgi:hypothetical protein